MPHITATLHAGNDPSHTVWHPAPDGTKVLWLWDGTVWLDPIAELQSQIAEMVIPHLEDMFAQGFAAGVTAERSAVTATIEGGRS